MLSNIDLTLKRISRVIHDLGVFVVIPLLIGLITLDVILRYLFNNPLAWGNEVSALLLLLVFFSALPHCTLENGHIIMDLLYKKFGPKLKMLTDLLSALSGLLFSALLMVRTVQSAFEMYEWNVGAEMIEIPYWPFIVFVCVCSVILTLIFLLRLVTSLTGNPSEQEN